MSGGSFSRRFDPHVLEYAKLLRERRQPRLTDFLAREPDDGSYTFLSSLIVEDFSIRASRRERPWVSDYFEVDRLAEARPAVCQALNGLLYDDGGKVARLAGVDRFGGYRTTGILGFGGFATAFSAEGPDDRRRAAAIKVCHPSVPDGAAMLRNEAAVLRKLDGRGGAPRLLDEVSDEGNYTYVAMERVAGQSLSSWLSVGSDSQPSVHARVAVCIRLASALRSLHGFMVVHGDLSPDNIVVCENDRETTVRLIDYAQSYDGWRWNEYFPVVTVPYAAPELLARESPATYASDIWSMAVVMFEVLTGERPFGEFKARQPIGHWLENIKSRRVRLPVEFGASLRSVLYDAMSTTIDKRPPIDLFQSALHQAQEPAHMDSIMRLGDRSANRIVDAPAVRLPPDAAGRTRIRGAEPVDRRPQAPQRSAAGRPGRRPVVTRFVPAVSATVAIALVMIGMLGRYSWRRESAQTISGPSSGPSPSTAKSTGDKLNVTDQLNRSGDANWAVDAEDLDFDRATKLSAQANGAGIDDRVRANLSAQVLALCEKYAGNATSSHAPGWLEIRSNALNHVGWQALKEVRFDDAEHSYQELLTCNPNASRWRAVALRRLGDAWLGREIQRRNDPTARAQAMNEAIRQLRAASDVYRDPAVGDKDAAAEAETWIGYCQKPDFGQRGQ